jgi:hypothetical protein
MKEGLALKLAAFVAVLFALSFVAALAWSQDTACTRFTGSGDSGVYVNLNNETSTLTIAHEREALAAGQPRILHWRPDLADAHRKAALKGIATAPGFDRDEYPPASSFEGGAGSDVKLVPRADNRSAGQRLGVVMHQYCSGQAFIIEP